MGRKNFNAYIKKQKEEKRRKAREEKKQKKEARKSMESSGKLEDMMAYLDADGNIISEPPEEQETKEPDDEKK